MPTPTVINQWRYSDAINRRYWDNRYFIEPMNVNPAVTLLGGGAAAGADTEVDVISTNKNMFEMLNIGTNTNIGPKVNATLGWNLATQATAAHGVEYDTGITTLNPFTFKIGTDAAFFTRCQFNVATINGVNPLIIGFRVLAARNATLTSYTDFAVIGAIGGAGGKIQTETQIGSGGAVTTDTTNTASDATLFTLEVDVDNSGNVTYKFNGVAPTTTVAYKFTSGITVMPFIRCVQSATTTASALAANWECGFQS